MACCEIEVTLQESSELEIEFREDAIEVGDDEFVKVIAAQADTYDGPYEVTPLAHQEVKLETRDRLMADDVTVREVPIYEVSNESGTTVYIATLED